MISKPPSSAEVEGRVEPNFFSTSGLFMSCSRVKVLPLPAAIDPIYFRAHIMYYTSFRFAHPPYCFTSCSRGSCITIIPSIVEIGGSVVEERNLKNIIFERASVPFFELLIF